MRKAAHLATAAVLALALVAGAPAMAQKAQTVADIRAELGVLNGQVQQLRDQLVQSGAAGGLSTAPASALTRLDAARNQNAGSGVGLGLSIAVDVARAHGGVLRLSESEALGGLRADIVIAR